MACLHWDVLRRHGGKRGAWAPALPSLRKPWLLARPRPRAPSAFRLLRPRTSPWGGLKLHPGDGESGWRLQAASLKGTALC